MVESIPENLSQIQVDRRVSRFLEDLKDDNFKICERTECLNQKTKEAIFSYLKKWSVDSMNTRNWTEENFNHIFTFDNDKWVSGCVSRGYNEPRRLIEFIIETDNEIGLGGKSGGIAISSWFTVFEKSKNGISNHWTVYRYTETLPSLIGELTDPKKEIFK